MDGGASIVNRSRDGMSLSSISYNVVFTDIGAFFRRVNFFHNLHFLITVQEQLKSKRSPLRQAILHFAFQIAFQKKVTLSTLAVFLILHRKI